MKRLNSQATFGEDSDTWKGSERKAEIIFMVLAVLLSTAIGMHLLDFPRQNWDALIGAGDMNLAMGLVESIREDGIYGAYFGMRIGAPEVSALLDTPFLDPSTILLYFTCSLFTRSAAGTIYLSYIATFPVITLTMYVLLRRNIQTPSLRAIFSVLGSVTPFHVMRGLAHFTIANYWPVPLFVALALYIAGLGGEEESHGKRRFVVYCVAALAGLGNVYFVFFGLMLMVLGLIFQCITEKNKRGIYKSLGLIGLSLITFVLGLMPKILYSITNGRNTAAGVRSPIEAEVYGLKLSQMLLPQSYSRFFGSLTDAYNGVFPINENATSALGLAGVAGLVLMLVLLIWSLVKRQELSKPYNWIALLTLALILWCSAGGLSSLFSLFVFPEIRCPNRASIYIDVLCLLTLAIALDHWICSHEGRSRKFAYITVAVLTLITLVDTATHVRVSSYSADGVTLVESKHQYYASIENTLPSGAMVYELPFHQFPEAAPVNQMDDYEQFEAYVYTTDLRWSYGGMKGRNLAAEQLYIDDGMSEQFVDGLIGAGFSGVEIYANAYEDGAVEINRFYTETLGLQPIVSDDGLRYFYDIRQLGQQ